MTTPVSQPAAPPPVDRLTRELAAQRHRVVYTGDGGEPSLVFTGGQLRAYVMTGRDAAAVASELRLGETLERRDLLAEGLTVAPGDAVRIVPLYAQGEREWFSVIEVPPAGELPPVAAPAWRVRVVERSGGRGKVLASHESYAHRSQSQIRSLYALNGEVAIVPWGASLYAVANGRVIVLDGPGDDVSRFHERSDPDCPPNKRCYQLPAEIDAKTYLGRAPDGRSIVMADGGVIVRRELGTGVSTSYGYNNFYFTGIVEDAAVVLAHAGEPPFVKRWAPASASPTSSSPPLPAGRRAAAPTPAAVQTGDGELLVAGPSYDQLASTRDGALYGVTRAGVLDRIAEGRATPVVQLPPGHRVVAIAAADVLAFVVVDDSTPPVYSVVIAGR